MSEKKNNRRTISSLKLFRDIIIKNEEDIFEKSFNKKKEMITYKNLQNLDLTTYDFLLFIICVHIIHFFLLENIYI